MCKKGFGLAGLLMRGTPLGWNLVNGFPQRSTSRLIRGLLASCHTGTTVYLMYEHVCSACVSGFKFQRLHDIRIHGSQRLPTKPICT
jgi:hypothetical protein